MSSPELCDYCESSKRHNTIRTYAFGPQRPFANTTTVQKVDVVSFVSVAEHKKLERGFNLVAKWTTNQPLVEVPDTFNDNITYYISKFSDLELLNNSIATIANKYGMFGDSQKAVSHLALLLQNLETIQNCLREVEDLVRDECSQLEHIQEEVDKANAILFRLLNKSSVEISNPDGACDQCSATKPQAPPAHHNTFSSKVLSLH
jgi:hypothetical protein